MATSKKRYVGLDVHKHYVVVGAVAENQQVVMPPRKVALVELEGWAKLWSAGPSLTPPPLPNRT